MPAGRCGRRMDYDDISSIFVGHGKHLPWPEKRTGEGVEGADEGGHSISTYLFAAVISLTLTMATPVQERTSEDVLTWIER